MRIIAAVANRAPLPVRAAAQAPAVKRPPYTLYLDPAPGPGGAAVELRPWREGMEAEGAGARALVVKIEMPRCARLGRLGPTLGLAGPEGPGRSALVDGWGLCVRGGWIVEEWAGGGSGPRVSNEPLKDGKRS